MQIEADISFTQNFAKLGLRMLLRCEQADYMDFTSRSGFVVAVQSGDVASFPMDHGTFLPVGYMSSLGVTLV